MFAIRHAARKLNIKLDWIDKIVCVNLSGAKATLDVEEFVRRLLSKTGSLDRMEELLEQISSTHAKFLPDPRFHIHGHDLTRMLKYYLKKNGVGKAAESTLLIARALALGLNKDDLMQYPLFSAVDEFASTA